MRRSPEPRVAARGEVLFQAMQQPARIVNLSRGGVCVCGALPPSHDETWPIAVGLADGREPIRASARLAWVNPAGDGEDVRTFGLCFTQLAAADRARLDAEVAMPAAPERTDEARPVRLRLDGGPVLRATAESIDEHHAVVSAEIPWLRVHSTVEAQLDDRTASGRVAWVGVEQTPAGGTRLRMRLELGGARAETTRRDQTLPYFSTDAMEQELPARSPLAEAIAAAPAPRPRSMLRRLVRRDPSGAYAQIVSLVKVGTRRRTTLALLRVAVAVLAVSAAVLLVRAVRPSSGASHEPAVAGPGAP